MQKTEPRHASWQELLGSPAPASHIVQLYDNDEFLAAAVGCFAAEGLRKGEAVLLTGTKPHLQALEHVLKTHGIEQRAVVADGRLILSDVHEAVRSIVDDDNTVDAGRFQAITGEAIAAAQADTRFSGVRWWGELSNVLHLAGNTQAALAAERLGDAAAKKFGVKIFCSYYCDRYDPRAYDGFLTDVCAEHTHVIPAQNYVIHRMAVNRAMAEVIGEIRGPLLQSLMSWKGLSCDLPSSQAILFWIREAMPEHFAAVLERAKCYAQTPSAPDYDAEPA